MSFADGRLFFFVLSCRGGTGISGRLMPAGISFFTYGLPVASSRYLAIVRKRPLASVRCSVLPCASAIRASPMALSAAASVARPKK